MARVEFRTSAIRQHGFPQACVTCGNDADRQLAAQKLPSKKRWIGCLLFFFGPIGWLLMLMVLFKWSKQTNMVLPVCALCNKGYAHVKMRLGVFLSLGTVCAFAQSWDRIPQSEGWYWAAALLALYGLAEYAWLSSQFRIEVESISDEVVVVRVPNDDYPALYERHLDNALLYGSSETLGARADSL